jgi:hypothetical protein
MSDPDAARQRTPKQAFQVVFVIAGVLILPAALTLRTVVYPGVLEITSDNPTPAGYTWSLLLFIIPIVALSGWFARPAVEIKSTNLRIGAGLSFDRRSNGT